MMACPRPRCAPIEHRGRAVRSRYSSLKKMADRSRKRLSYGSLITTSSKKRRRVLIDSLRNRTRVVIGKEFDRWDKLKREEAFTKHEEVAKLLLDSYERNEKAKALLDQPSSSLPKISTPAVKYPGLLDPGLSEISMQSSETCEAESELSGVESQSLTTHTHKDVSVMNKPQKKDDSFLFVDPFELTIESIETVTSQEFDSDDADYEPSFSLNLRPQNIENMSEMSYGELEFGNADDGEEDRIEDEEEFSEKHGVHVINQDECSSLAGDGIFLIFKSSIMLLAKKVHVESHCRVKGCMLPIDIEFKTIGSALYLKWVCEKSHVNFQWCSQPILNNRLHSGDLLSSFACLASGNNFAKLALFAKFLNLNFLSSWTYNKIQRNYLVPSINEFWSSHQENLLRSFKDKVVVAGDGRMDSPGHSAQYCTYSLMEDSTSQVLSIVAVDKRETQLKSAAMEKVGFERAMQELSDKSVDVKEVVTDQHLQIAALMKNKYESTKHSYDVWHAAKNLAKKINLVGNEKDKKDLLKWTKDIINHFWYSCQLAENEDEFRGVWLGVIHHVVNEHSWVLPYGAHIRECRHGPLTTSDETEGNSEKWLKKGGPAHLALQTLVLDKNLLKKISYFLNFRSTSQLESFNQLVLMYAGKRFAYSPPVYKCRTLLAALDHNHHANREIQINKDGSTRYHRVYNKKNSRWSVHPVRVKKTYSYMNDLKVKVLGMRLSDELGMQIPQELHPTDPRRISGTIGAIDPPSTKDLVRDKKSRMSQE